MASRAIWKGQLRLSLVSIPVEIHSAKNSSKRVSFRQIHQPSGKPVRYEKVVAGVGPVESSEIMKGYEVGDDEYILLEPEEIDAIKLETKKTLELVQFVDATEIAPLWFDRPYYVIPTDDLAEDAYRVVRDALRKARKTALGQLTMRGKEYLCAIRPCGDGLLMETLHYESDIRSAEPLFSSIEDKPADDELLDVATQLIERKTAPFDASAFKDHYAEALRELIARKQKSKTTKRTKTSDSDKAPEATNVVDLMDALKKSLKDGGTAKKKAPAKKPAAKSGGGSRKKAS
ncbi:Ku domain protein [Oceanicola granulosus HTCC2516]|uniref:Non-homologous end joining protein Ku n=1 Tax=Oceanicola granulosus (strain ATCC BAA-861 / DSM 15982 / KCTC 12143 / HTCC2516) TaxID=314256 RepID=Q2CDX2_OCEGH|nr:Ku protein [Oceanicola granulosus]EAR50856.1 Ku domain protein [Oceanicola granulosus HTCC2516]